MGMRMKDFYSVLNVPKDAGDEELRRAYKKLAMRWHPDKHPGDSKRAVEAKFKQICEAYGVLSDSQKRQIYDLYGEDGLKAGYYNVSSPAAEAAAFRRSGHRKGTSCKHRSRKDGDVFADYFEDVDGGQSPGSENANFAGETGKSEIKSKSRSESENKSKSHRSETEKKAAPVENKLACTLEELYTGSKRKMKISRIVLDDQSGKPRTVEEVLSIDINPGWKKGTKITFPSKGNQEPGLLPGDLIFIIDEKPHSTFKRDGNDLLIRQKLSLLEALTGKTLNLTTLDNRNLPIEVSDIVKPRHEIVIPNEGMPLSKEPKKRGNLRIKFDIKFPSKLSSDQKTDLRRVLGRSS